MRPSEFEKMLTSFSTDELAAMLQHREELRDRRLAALGPRSNARPYAYSIRAIKAELERRQMTLLD